jgi:hypothetical protein
MKILFLDLDGVLNTWQYSNLLIKNGLSEFDEKDVIQIGDCNLNCVSKEKYY